MSDVCVRCGCSTNTDALRFLHEQLHAEPFEITYQNLRQLPFALFPRVAKLMEDFADQQIEKRAKERADRIASDILKPRVEEQ